MFVPAMMPATVLARDIIDQLGLSSGLKLCLDAGDAASYTSGQSWLDRSGGGYDFFRGTTSGAEGSDPTFNGVAGRASSGEYFSFDGGDYFTYDSANETWMQNFHKSGFKGTIAKWYYPATSGVVQILAGTNNGELGKVGFQLNVRSSNVLRFSATNGSVSVRNLDSTAIISAAAWNFLAVSVDEAGNVGVTQVNGTQETNSASYASPSASSATHAMQIAASGNGSGGGASPPPNGSRMPVTMTWEGVALTATQLMDIFNATRSRFRD